MVQWLGIHLAKQGTLVRPPVSEKAPGHGGAEPAPPRLSLCPGSQESQLLSHGPPVLKPECPRACAPQQESPLQ